MYIHLINLDRSADRREEFCDINRHLSSVARLRAVDGQTLDIPALVRQGVIAEGLVSKDFYTRGAVGAALSHIGLWDMAISKNEMMTAAEDDVIFHYQFEPLAEQVIGRLPSDWDFILWGFNFDMFLCFEMMSGITASLSQFEQERLRKNIDKFQTLPVVPAAFRLIWAFGIPCYSVTPKGARALRDICLPIRPTVAEFPAARRAGFSGGFRNVGIDSGMNNAYSKINAYVCVPPLVVTKNDGSRSLVQEKSA